MGKNMNLNNLTPEEAHKILEVIQKDFEVRQREKERLCKIEEAVDEEQTRTNLLIKHENFNQNCCIRCCETFGIIFNRKQTCRRCLLFVCKACCQYDDGIKGYICKACLKNQEFKTKSFDWFYKNVSEKFKRFGSAKVVRSLYKHADMGRANKYHSDNESDSGYDPSLYSSFGQSGSGRGFKSRPSLSGIFPDIVITDEAGEELDNSLIPPPLLSPNNNSFQKSPPPSLDNKNLPRSPTTPTPDNVYHNDEVLDNKEKEKRDIYREAFENTTRTEEAKFKIRFDNLLSDMTKSIEKQSPRDGSVPAGFGSTSYGEFMSTYRTRIKDLLVSLSQRLELAVESFDETSPHSPSLTSQKVRQMISKLIEDRLGEALDLTSDEAVSDLSSLSDESGEQKSYEDQIAQAVIAKVLELHRQSGHNINLDIEDENEAEMDQQTDSSGSEEKMVNRTMSSSFSEEKNVIDSIQTENLEKIQTICDKKLDKNQNVHNVDLDYIDGEGNVSIEERDDVFNEIETKTAESLSPNEVSEPVLDERELLKKEFEKLRTFAHEVVPRPLYEEIKMEEEVEQEPIEETFDKVEISHEESRDEFSSRFFTYDKVHDSENRGLPDFSYLDDDDEHYFGVNEIDPDLLSMNLAPIAEETEEELEDDKEDETEYEQDWRGNWIFKGRGLSHVLPYIKPNERPQPSMMPPVKSDELEFEEPKSHKILRLKDLLYNIGRSSMFCDDRAVSVPPWTIFQSRVEGDILTSAATVVFNPIIMSSPTDISTVYTTLKRAKEQVNALGQNLCPIVFDMGLLSKALEVVWAKPEQFEGVILLEGGMHFLMSCFAGIGFVYGELGLKELLYESDVFAKQTAEHILSGKDFDRALRAILLVDEALNMRFLVNFKKWLEQQHNEKSDKILKEITSCLSGIAEGETDLVNLILGKIDADICPMVEQFRLEGREASPLFQFWDDYLTKVSEPLKLYLASSRHSMWESNHYSKCAQGISPYSNLSKKTVGGDFSDLYMTIPHPNNPYNPTIGSRDIDDMSDLSENGGGDSLDGLSDEENTFYAKTSEEIARITRKSKTSTSTQASAMANSSVQTEDESEAESLVSRPYSSSFSDSGVKSAKMEQNSFDSRTSENLRKKLSEELVPSEGDDPKFEIPPMSVSIPEGEPAKLTCRVAGTQPLDVFWYRVNDEAEELENSENYEVSKEGCRHNLTMYNMTRDDHGQYMCMAINEKGRCCQYFILTVKKNTQELKTPEFLKTLTDVEVSEGQSVKFRCKVKGYPQPRVTWYKDGQLLSSQLNCSLEKFGNRDYLLAIETASMDEDAEYSVLAKNIAGEVRSSAQLIVEPKNKPETESAPAPSKKISTQEPEPERPESPPLIPRLPYLPSSRKSLSATRKTSPSTTKDEQNLSNISQKVSMTKDSVSQIAEDMLSSTKELTEINQSIAAMDRILAEIECDISSSAESDDIENNNGVASLGTDQRLAASHKFWVTREAAEKARKVTSAALDILDSTDSVILREKRDMDALATSTPRNSMTDKMLISEDVSHVERKSAMDSLNTSEDSHTSEISFSIAPITSKPVSKVNDKDSHSHTQKTQTQSSARTVSAKGVVDSQSLVQNTVTQSEKDIASPRVKLDNSMEVSDLNSSLDSQDIHSADSESLRLNFGPKRENKEWYKKDFYITNTPVLQRKSSESSDKEELSPWVEELSPRVEKQRAHTEEKIYLTAGNVYNLETKVQSLADKVKAVNALAEQDKMERLEDQVARTVAKVAHAEREVKSVEKSVNKITETKQPTFKTKMAPPKPRPITPPQERPEPTFLKGTTAEKDLPESRTEFNEDYGSIELPSVNRLKAMFGQSHQSDKDSSLRRIHSITARSVPKDQLEKLRRYSDEERPKQNIPSRLADTETRNPGRATALTTGQQIKLVPEQPKQVFQSSNLNGQISASAKVKVQSPRQNIIKPPVSNSNPAKSQPIKITLTNNINRPLSPVQSEPVQQTCQPIKVHVAGKAEAPKTPSQSNNPSQTVKTGSEIDTPEGRKSPKIRTGAISAMSRFWEKRLNEGETDDEYPELLDN